MKSVRIALALAIGFSLFSSGILAAAENPPKNGTATKEITVTGQHRGYTNDQLFLRLDDEKEMTFLVRIPGDTQAKWHDEFKTLSRISVTYHVEKGQKFLVATAIKSAPKP